MAWVLLVGSGLLEAVWAAALPATRGLTRLWPTVLFAVALFISMFGLAKATETIPIGTGYAIWVSMGVIGTVIAGVAFYGETLSLARVGFVALLLVAIFGLKVTAPTG